MTKYDLILRFGDSDTKSVVIPKILSVAYNISKLVDEQVVDTGVPHKPARALNNTN